LGTGWTQDGTSAGTSTTTSNRGGTRSFFTQGISRVVMVAGSFGGDFIEFWGDALRVEP
jgi:hypothetical protein